MWASTCNEGMFYVMLRNCVSFWKRFTDLNRRVIFLGIFHEVHGCGGVENGSEKGVP